MIVHDPTAAEAARNDLREAMVVLDETPVANPANMARARELVRRALDALESRAPRRCSQCRERRGLASGMVELRPNLFRCVWCGAVERE